MKIQVLPPNIRDQIAAGEVVESPASVVKELVENALDAKAQNIDIYLKNGGKSFIKIVDDGVGMAPDDTEKSVLRYATSKISSIDDLFSIRSFGFRGEALAAISSVSEFEIFSRDDQTDFGTAIKISAGNVFSKTNIPANRGTSITVENLFFPTPARRQYLKTDDAEYRKILKEIYGFALTASMVSFRVFKDEKLVLDFPKTENLKHRVQQVLKKLSENLMEVNFQTSDLKIFGFSSTPEAGIAHRNHQFLFVNHRRIEDQKLAFAVREAYRQSCGIEKHLYPFFVLYLEIDPILVDINVHPRKLEVKFAEPGDVFSAIKNSVTLALKTFSSGENSNFSGSGAISSHTNDQNKWNSSQNEKSQISFGNRFNRQIYENPQSTFRFSEKNKERSLKIFEETSDFSVFSKLPDQNDQISGTLKLIGQSANKYIMAENNFGIYFFDQHALHERQRFEKFWQEYRKIQKVQRQKLLIPEVLKFTENEISVFFEQKTVLENLGFLLKFPQDDTLEILEIPIILNDLDLEKIFQEILVYFENEMIGENVSDRIMRKLLEYKSCRGAVMFGDRLEKAEMEKLIEDFDKTDWALLCPHGRPNHFFLPFPELDKKFHR